MGNRVRDESKISEEEYSENNDDDDSLNDSSISSSSDKSVQEDEEDEEEKGNEETEQHTTKKLTEKGYGRNWLYFAHVKNDEHLTQICRQNCLEKTNLGPSKQVYLTCKRSRTEYRRKHPPPYCPMRAMYIPEKKNLYVKGGHDHAIEKDVVKSNAKKTCASSNKYSDKSALVCSDGRFPYFANVENHSQLMEICQQNGLAKIDQKMTRKYKTKTISRKSNVTFIRCKRSSSATNNADGGHKRNCPVKGIYVPKNQTLYLRNSHNHPLEDEDRADENIIENKYVDQKGDHWPLLRHVSDEQELAELRKQQWLTQTKTLRVGNYYRCKHNVTISKWPIKRSKYCPFRTILYKPNSNMYYMGAHDHPLEEKKGTLPKVGEPYVDCYGKVWRHSMQFPKNISMADLANVCRQKHQLYNGTLKNNKVRFQCAVNEHFDEDKKLVSRCKYRAIFLTENCCLYVLNEHNHEFAKINGFKADFVDRIGKKSNRFLTHVMDEKHLNEICQKHWLIKHESYSTNRKTMYFKCSTTSGWKDATNRGEDQQPDFCPIKGVYVARRRAFYISKEGHNHPLSNNEVDDVVEANEDGGVEFNEEEGNEEEDEEESTDEEEEEESDEEETGEEDEDVMEDSEEEEEQNGREKIGQHATKKLAEKGYGRNWLYFAHVKNDEHLTQICQQNSLTRSTIGAHKQVNITCKRSSTHYRRRYPPPYCPMRALYIPEKKSLYVKGQHDHPIVKDMAKSKIKRTSATLNKVCDKTSVVCIDETWPFFSNVRDYGHLSEICRQNCLVKSVRSSRRYWTKNGSGISSVMSLKCKRSSSDRNDHGQKACPIQGIYIVARQALYLRNGHNHPMEVDDIADQNIVDNKFVDKKGKHWPLLSHVRNEQHLTELCQQQWLNQLKSHQNTNYYRCKHFSLLNKWPNERRKYCLYRTIPYKPNSSMYYMGEHDHPLEEEEKNAPPKVGEPYVDRLGRVWRYFKQFPKNISMTAVAEVCREKYRLSKIGTWRLSNLHFQCILNQNYHRDKKLFNSPCEYRAIFVKKNGCLYVRNEHNHKKSKTPVNTNKGPNADYLERLGKSYSLLSQIESDKNLMEICQMHWLNKFRGAENILQGKNIYFKCSTTSGLRQSRTRKETYCQIKGIYMASKRALYVSKEGHNHALDEADKDTDKEEDEKESNEDELDCSGEEEEVEDEEVEDEDQEQSNKDDQVDVDSDLEQEFNDKQEEKKIDEEEDDEENSSMKEGAEDDEDEDETEGNEESGEDESENEVDKLLIEEADEKFLYEQEEDEEKAHDPMEVEEAGEEGRVDELDEEEPCENVDEEEEKPEKEAVQPIGPEQGVEDLQIVRAIIRDYKWLPGMKREGEKLISKNWPIFTIEDPNDYGKGQVTSKKSQKNMRKVKKELQPNIARAPPNPMQPSTSGAIAAAAPKYWWQQQAPAGPAKRLLRERKGRINYAD